VAANAMRRVISASASRQVSEDGIKQLILAYKAPGANGAVQKDWKPRPGFIYSVVRAISARTNQNYDTWPSSELKKSYHTFVGKPVFVNHNNADPKKARGKVIAARYVENGDDKYIEAIMEVDAQRFPKLAKELREGGLDSVSMGVEAGFTICSHCGNKAHDEPEFCDHVRNHKGSKLYNPKTGKVEPVHEYCYKLGFFELSYVFEPADETALVNRVMIASNQRTAQDDRRKRYPEELLEVMQAEKPTGGKDDTDYRQFVKQSPVVPDSWGSNRATPAAGGGSGGGGGGSVGSPDAQGILPNARPLYDAIKSEFPDIEIGGYRPPDGYNEHNRGALDVMTTDPQVAETVKQLAFEHGAPYVIWQQQLHYPDGSTKWMEDRGSPTQNHMDHVHTAPIPTGGGGRTGGKVGHLSELWDRMYDINIRDARRRHAFGETEMPEDIDTLRDDEFDTLDDYQFVEPIELNTQARQDNPFKHWLESPEELRGPDFDLTKRLDYQQEVQGLDKSRLVENFGEVGADIDGDPDFEDAPARRNVMGRTRRTSAPRKRAAEDDPVLEELEEVMGEDLDGDNEEGEPEEHAEEVLDDEDTDDGGEDEGDDEEEPVDEVDERAAAEAAEAAALVEELLAAAEQLAGGPLPEEQQLLARRRSARSAKTRRRAGKKGRRQKGQSAMSLTERARVASERRRRRFADTSGHTDGSPYGRNDQGEREDTFITQTPDGEPVEAPNGDPPISNTLENLVASLRQRILDRRAARRIAERGIVDSDLLRRYVLDYLGEYADAHDVDGLVDELARQVGPSFNPADYPGPDRGVQFLDETIPSDLFEDLVQNYRRDRMAALQRANRQAPYAAAVEVIAAMPAAQRKSAAIQMAAAFKDANPRFSPRKFFAAIQQRLAVEDPEKHDPPLSGTDDQGVKGQNFDDVGLDDVETQPKDASKKVLSAFDAFDQWLRSTTGKTAAQHSPKFLRRQAARWAKANGINVESLYPGLGVALRQARKNGGGSIGKGTSRGRTANESLDVAAPQARIDVEKPVEGVTDADAQSSQYDLEDFGNNAGDDIADPELSSDSQIWAPGEKGEKSARKTAGSATAMRYAEAAQKVRLVTTPEDKWKLASQAETMREEVVVDRTRLMEAILQANPGLGSTSQKRYPAPESASRSVPRGLTSANARVAAAQRAANSDGIAPELFL